VRDWRDDRPAGELLACPRTSKSWATTGKTSAGNSVQCTNTQT